MSSSMFDQLFLGGSNSISQESFPDLDHSTGGYHAADSQHVTVSPQDLFADDHLVISNPPSAAFPTLDTPGTEFLDSPDLSNGLNTTPMEDGLLDSQLDFIQLENLPSLFPEETYDQFGKSDVSPALVANSSFESLTDMRSPAQGSPMVRQKSSPGRPPITAASHLRKHSLTNGVNKAAVKPRKNLVEIVIDDDDDKETAKRKKNTAAARKSRQRKQEIMEEYAGEIQRLRAMVINLGGNPDQES